MEYIFEIITQLMMAYFQIIVMIVGGVIFVVGATCLISLKQNKNKYRHWIRATVVSLREGEGMADENNIKSTVYFPVFEAVGSNGDLVQYEHKTGSGNINKYPIGSKVQISPSPTEPGFADTKSSGITNIVMGLTLLLIGGMMVGAVTTFIPITSVTLAIWGATLIGLFFKFRKYIKPKALRETIQQFRLRKGHEILQEHQGKPVITAEVIQDKNQKFDRVITKAARIYIVIGFAILCLGGAGYNAQLEFIDRAVLIKSGPCGLELGEDCPRKILYQDALSIVPIEFRPVMDGVYHSKYDPEQMIVSYGRWTPMPYFMLMALGSLIILSSSKRLLSRQ